MLTQPTQATISQPTQATICPDRDYLIALLSDCVERERNSIERAESRGMGPTHPGDLAALALVQRVVDALERRALNPLEIVKLLDLLEDLNRSSVSAPASQEPTGA